jgi:hypothetical protein
VEGAAPAAVGQVLPEHAGATFQDFMSRVVDLQMAGTAPEEVTRVLQAFGLSVPRDVATRPDLAPAILSALPLPPVG